MFDVLTQAIMSADEWEKLQKGKDILVGFDRKVLITPQFLKELQEKDIRNYSYLDYAGDILILHGTQDEIVPFDAARAFAEENCIEFIPVPGADHRFRSKTAMDLAIKTILEFFKVYSLSKWQSVFVWDGKDARGTSVPAWRIL